MLYKFVMFQKLTWSVFISRESGADAAHLLLQHGLPGLAVPLPQRHGRPHPRLYGEYPFKHTPVGLLNKVRGLFVLYMGKHCCVAGVS